MHSLLCITNVNISCTESEMRVNELGIVELYYNADWYPVCGEDVGPNEARTICHTLNGTDM